MVFEIVKQQEVAIFNPFSYSKTKLLVLVSLAKTHNVLLKLVLVIVN